MVREDGKHVGWIYEYECIDTESKWFGWNYVGQTRDQKGLNARDLAHRNQSHGKSKFDRVYQKHPESFQLNVVDEIVCDTEKELVDRLNWLESYYILVFCSFKDWGSGFNLTTGGGEKVFSEETRKKMSERTKAALANPEVRKKMSEATKKHLENHEYRKKWLEATQAALANPEARMKRSEALKKHFENHEERRKQSERLKAALAIPEARMKRSEATKKPCQLLDLETGFVMYFESGTKCAEFLQVDRRRLSEYKTKPYKGRWIYIPNKDLV